MPPNGIEEEILKLLEKRSEGIKISDIAKSLGIQRQTISKYIYGLETAGIVEHREVGRAKVYFLRKDSKKKIKFALLISLSLSLFFIPIALAQTQSHPLSEITPIDVNLDMFQKNITNVSHIGVGLNNPSYRLDVSGSARISNDLFILNRLGIGTTMPRTRLDIFSGVEVYFTIGPASSHYTDLAHNIYWDGGWRSYGGGPGSLIRPHGGSSLRSAISFWTSPDPTSVGAGSYINLYERMRIDHDGNVGIGTTTPVNKLNVVGTINSTENITASNYVIGNAGLCIGNVCKTSWAIETISPWDNSTTWTFIRDTFPRNVNVSNILFVNATTGNIGIGMTNPGNTLDIQGSLRLRDSSTPAAVNGTIYFDTTLKRFRCYQGTWTDCITSITEPGTGFWTLTGSMLYANRTHWNVGIGTTAPSERLEVQGRVLIASSNPFELEPSDQILDVKGSINASIVFYVPKSSTQPFVCDLSREAAIFFNTTDKKFYGCTGTAWVIIGTQA